MKKLMSDPKVDIAPAADMPFNLHLCHHSSGVTTMGAIFLAAYILVGIAQIWAGIEGMHLYFGIGGFLAVILLLFAYSVPVVGTIGVAFLAYYGAHHDWKWEWWQALILAVPSVIITLAAGALFGLAIWAQRVNSLISLHHHLARDTSNKDRQQIS
jgi:hypothetical protein